VSLNTCDERDFPHGGGGEVHVRGLTCTRAGQLLPRFGLPLDRNDPSEAIFDRGNGWTCWTQLPAKSGPAQNVCWRDAQVLIYKYH
jgi:hypothetical protein